MAISTIDNNGVNLGQLGNRNLIINGNFSISQRGVYTSASSVSNGVYYLDRWKVHSGVAGTLQDTGYKVKVVATSTASGVLAISQSIEDKNIHPHKGKVVTVSCKVTSNSSNARIVIYADDWMALGSQNDVHSGGGNEETLSATFTVPSNLSGFLQVRVGFENAASNGNPSVSANDYFEVSEVQLELGDTATPFEHRSYGDELLACKRYFQRIAGGESGITGSAIMTGVMHNSTFLEGIYKMEVEMRTEPTLERVAGTNYYGFSRTGTQDQFNSLSIDSGAGNPRQVNLYNATEVSGTAGVGGIVFSRVEEAIVSLSAEL